MEGGRVKSKSDVFKRKKNGEKKIEIHSTGSQLLAAF